MLLIVWRHIFSIFYAFQQENDTIFDVGQSNQLTLQNIDGTSVTMDNILFYKELFVCRAKGVSYLLGGHPS